MFRSGLALALVTSIAGCASTSASSPPTGRASDSVDVAVTVEPVPPAFLQSELDALNALATLAPTVVECVVRSDTGHPVFHGCIDWHSAVHGNYALRAAGRLLDDPGLIATARSVVSTDALSAELADVTSDNLASEVPYGFSWFLILDTEARDPAMAALASAVAARLDEWVATNVLFDDAAMDADYHNLGFAVFALHQWYRQFDPASADRLRADTQDLLAAAAVENCQPDRQVPQREFLDPCFTLALALAEYSSTDSTAPVADAMSVLTTAVLSTGPLREGEVTSIHAAGLNFSRAWGAYALYRTTGDVRLLQAGDELVRTHVALPQYWRDGYREYAHWVAQFGILAIALRQDAVNAMARTGH